MRWNLIFIHAAVPPDLRTVFKHFEPSPGQIQALHRKEENMLLTKSQLNKASEKDLSQAAEAIKAEIAKRASNSKEKAMKELKAVAAKHGMSLDALLGGKSPKAATKAPRAKKAAGKTRGKVAPKYANPADTSQTWTGRGRQPLWVGAALAAGKSLDALLIK